MKGHLTKWKTWLAAIGITALMCAASVSLSGCGGSGESSSSSDVPEQYKDLEPVTLILADALLPICGERKLQRVPLRSPAAS